MSFTMERSLPEATTIKIRGGILTHDTGGRASSRAETTRSSPNVESARGLTNVLFYPFGARMRFLRALDPATVTRLPSSVESF